MYNSLAHKNIIPRINYSLSLIAWLQSNFSFGRHKTVAVEAQEPLDLAEFELQRRDFFPRKGSLINFSILSPSHRHLVEFPKIKLISKLREAFQFN